MTGSNPLVSICIPTFNSSRYIRQCLDSVLAQTYPDVEILVSDNASSDGTTDILDEYAEKFGIRVLLNDVNSGAGENFNRLIANAVGEYVAIYHADDLYHPEIIARSVAVLQEKAEIGLVGTLAEVVDDAGRHLYDYCVPRRYASFTEIVANFDEALQAILHTRKHEIFFVTPSIMVRRNVYLAIGTFDQKRWSSSVDYEMWLRIALHYPVAVLNSPLMQYRIHAAQGSELEVRKNTGLPDILAVIQSYRQHLKKASIIRQCACMIDRIRIKTALKQNAGNRFTQSSETLEPLETMRYRFCAVIISCVNSLRLNMHMWP